MLALGLVLNAVGIGLFCWLIFALAVYAFPFFVGVNVGIAAFYGGAGVAGALLAGIASAALTLAAGQFAFVTIRPLILRVAVAAAFAVPAGIAGYHVMFAFSQVGVPSLLWREILAWIGAVAIGFTAWTRISLFAQRRPELGRAARHLSQSLLTTATRER
ncbi:MAG: hypothetical protein HY852_18715 [Bradyrhizobium sp.]|uniref:hypothetical protein n=1 Tax=Bradyrhizobium sp. TaxID=376 RepID=UPI0025C24525|nr:hypothetical protein [Bradyrhizobium sp.]MBI5263846.1 hypothetical protein [Bradyrhizobium sp.]